MFLVRRNLTAHPLRSILTALAIALGVAMMLSASVIGQAASQSAERLSQVNETDAVIQSGPGFNTLVFQALLTLVGVIVLFTAGFVIANAFGMAITARLKELGALRTLGMTRRQILNLVLIEAGLLGLAGAVGGLLLGLVLAGLALRLTGMGGNLSVPVWALIASPLIGFTVTVVAALFPALQASRVSPLETLKPESRITHHGTRNALLPASFILLILVGLGLYAFLAKPDVLTALIVLLPAMVILLALVALLMPALVGSVANLARPWLVRWVGQTAGRLAADNLQRHPTRAALTAGAMTAGLTMMIAMSGLLTVVLKGGLLTFVTIAREDRVVFLDITDLTTFRAENSLQVLTEAAPLDPELLARLQALADEGRIELGRMDMTAIPAELTPTPGAPGVFIDPELSLRRGSFDFSEGNVKDALRYFAQGPAVLLLPITAQRLNVQVGDLVSIQTLTGPVDFTVAGIGADVWVMTAFSFTDGQKYFGVTDPTFMGIFVREGQNKEAVLKQVDDIVADYGMVALDFKAILRGFFRIGDQIIGLMNALLLLTVLVAALGVVNTMVINVTERQREIGMLRAIGATQRQVRHMVVAEGATLGLFAVFVAVLLSLVIVLAYLLLVSPNGLQSLGFRLNWETVRNGFLPALPVMAQATLAALIFAPLIAGLAAYYPAKQAAALDVMEATRSERLTLQPSATRRVEGEPERGLPRSLPLLLAQRALSQNQTRTILSILAVALGAAMTIAGDVVGGAIVNALSQAEDVRAVAEG
ncbi:MAG: putative rane protein, partial [Anaerolineales bacterium]|nr:putative rane protein [Anaerolineales bacterium]